MRTRDKIRVLKRMRTKLEEYRIGEIRTGFCHVLDKALVELGLYFTHTSLLDLGLKRPNRGWRENEFFWYSPDSHLFRIKKINKAIEKLQLK